MAPGAGAGDELYSLPGEMEFVYVLEGALELQVGGRDARARAGRRAHVSALEAAHVAERLGHGDAPSGRSRVSRPGECRSRPDRRTSCRRRRGRTRSWMPARLSPSARSPRLRGRDRALDADVVAARAGRRAQRGRRARAHRCRRTRRARRCRCPRAEGRPGRVRRVRFCGRRGFCHAREGAARAPGDRRRRLGAPHLLRSLHLSAAPPGACRRLAEGARPRRRPLARAGAPDGAQHWRAAPVGADPPRAERQPRLLRLRARLRPRPAARHGCAAPRRPARRRRRRAVGQ